MSEFAVIKVNTIQAPNGASVVQLLANDILGTVAFSVESSVITIETIESPPETWIDAFVSIMEAHPLIEVVEVQRT